MRVGLFPGQGLNAEQVLGGLAEGDPLVRVADEVLGYRLRQRVASVASRPSASLPTSLAQPAIFTAGVGAYRRAADSGTVVDALLGHSLGEYAALVAGGSLTFEDGLQAVAARGEAMQAVGRIAPGTMAAVLGLDLDRVADIAAAAGVEIANDNAPGQLVIAGPEEGIARAAAETRSAGGRAILLQVSGAFHTPAMEAATAQVRAALEAVEVRSPRLPVVSNVAARPYRSPDDIVGQLVRQVTERVRFREALEWLWSCGFDDFVDFGPGRVVGGLASKTFKALSRPEVTAHA